jgi:hypothetical protein
MLSANPGQSITFEGTGFLSPAPEFDFRFAIVFQTIDSEGVRGERIVRPIATNGAGTLMTVIVPDDAITGPVALIGDANGLQPILQIVPVVESVTVQPDGTLLVQGRGLIEGNRTLYRSGASVVVDASASSIGFDVTTFNTRATLDVAWAGPDQLTVTTEGGVSAALDWSSASLNLAVSEPVFASPAVQPSTVQVDFEATPPSLGQRGRTVAAEIAHDFIVVEEESPAEMDFWNRWLRRDRLHRHLWRRK